MLAAFRAPISAMVAHQHMLDQLSNNLANISTPGFKASQINFEDLMYARTPVGGDVGNRPDLIATAEELGSSRSATDLAGAGVRISATPRNFQEGQTQIDGDPLHLTIQGTGYFVVRTADGGASYTRDGNFSRDAVGRIVAQNGEIVLPETRIPADARDVRVDSAGLVFARLGDSNGTDVEMQIGEVQIARFTNPQGLASVGGNYFLASDASGEALIGYPGQDGYGSILGGAIESSNVDVGEQMAAMLMGQRAYSLNVRALQTIDEMIGMANNLRR